jgi:polar amino acid transport system permease protein
MGAGMQAINVSPERQSRRLLWVLLSFVLLVAVVIYVVARLNESNFAWGYIPEHFFDGILLQGAQMTIILSVVSQIFGILLGLVAALFKISKNPVLAAVANFYIWLFRGTPLLVQLIVFATGLYQIGIRLDLFAAAILALSLNEGAYMAEIVRAGIQSIDPGQMEAGKSLGMTYGLAMRRIVLPQAARVIIPPTGNEFNNMLKSTSLANVIGIPELLTRAGDLNHLFFRNLETFVIISCYYLAMTTVVTLGQGWIESRLGERKGQAQAGFWSRMRANIFSVRRVGGS